MPDTAPRWLPWAVFVGFFVVHALLLFGTFDAVDLEETEYGNVAVALLDGHVDDYASLTTDPSHGDNLSGGAGRRRRTVWSAETLVTPVFAALGPSLLSLKLFTLLGGALWALCWFGVARRAAPRAPPYAAALLFILPLPLVQRAALSATNLFAHLGSSLFFGATLALMLRGTWPAVLSAGLVAGFGVYQSTSLLPLLLGPLYFAFRGRGVPAVLGFIAAMLPGLLLLAGFRDPGQSGDIASFFTGLTGGDPMRGDPIPATLHNLKTTLLYGAGFGRVDPDTLRLGFLPIGAAYTALVGLIFAVGWPRGGRPDPEPRHLRTALLLSAAAYALAWLKTGFQLETTYFDGLRYLLPISAVPTVFLLVAMPRLRRARKAAIGALLLAHAIGFALLFRPAAFPAPWHRLAGYEPTVMKQWMQGPLDLEQIPTERHPRWLRFAGTSAARKAQSTASLPAMNLPEHDHPEFWRGVGIGLLLRQSSDEAFTLPDNAPQEIVPHLVQGMAMGTAYVGCQQAIRERLTLGSEEDRWYGYGRADVYCKEHFGQDLGPRKAPWKAGLADGWRLDYGLDGEVDLDFLQRLYVY